ncbi:MAG: hypothetical protein CME36_02525 [unclassified Hahellaceae]|nr:hypothetical protein [Hahellaceae bacterium]
MEQIWWIAFFIVICIAVVRQPGDVGWLILRAAIGFELLWQSGALSDLLSWGYCAAAVPS